jgi:hypothetical protein
MIAPQGLDQVATVIVPFLRVPVLAVVLQHSKILLHHHLVLGVVHPVLDLKVVQDHRVLGEVAVVVARVVVLEALVQAPVLVASKVQAQVVVLGAVVHHHIKVHLVLAL